MKTVIFGRLTRLLTLLFATLLLCLPLVSCDGGARKEEADSATEFSAQTEGDSLPSTDWARTGESDSTGIDLPIIWN